MRDGVLVGTSKVLDFPFVTVASKSGTAELGVEKANVNSWISGFFPYEKPKYAFVITLEKGSVHNNVGALTAMRLQFEWMEANTPEYFAK
jgi:penicillin-binding protein 2